MGDVSTLSLTRADDAAKLFILLYLGNQGMPTYAYACPKCGHEYDKLQKMSDKTRAKCPECGTRGERLISGGTGFVFKGSGFYHTDYKRAGEAKPDEKGVEKSVEKGGGKGDKEKKTPPKDSPGASTPAKGKGADS